MIGTQQLKSFESYSTTVKHGFPLKVHQYKNKYLEYLNNDIPTKFKPVPQKTFRLSAIQAFYIASCIINEDFIMKNLGSGQHAYSLQALLIQLAEDLFEKSLLTKIKQDPRVKVKRELQEHFNYIQSVDFWLICDLNSFNVEKYLSTMNSLFAEEYLIVNQKAKVQLKNDFPEIVKKYNLE